MPRTIRSKRDYGFIDDKHEIIYVMMRLAQIRAGETGRPFWVVVRGACVEAGITIGAARGWFAGATRRPFADGALGFCAALGVDLLRGHRRHLPDGRRGLQESLRRTPRRGSVGGRVGAVARRRTADEAASRH